jgi:hypothetical protein
MRVLVGARRRSERRNGTWFSPGRAAQEELDDAANGVAPVFRTAQSTIIPAVFDLAPNRQITANWQIRRHAPAVENSPSRNTKPAVEGGPVSGKAGKVRI